MKIMRLRDRGEGKYTVVVTPPVVASVVFPDVVPFPPVVAVAVVLVVFPVVEVEVEVVPDGSQQVGTCTLPLSSAVQPSNTDALSIVKFPVQLLDPSKSKVRMYVELHECCNQS
jgi:hypothetical protein